jgi:hypothetical protein
LGQALAHRARRRRFVEGCRKTITAYGSDNLGIPVHRAEKEVNGRQSAGGDEEEQDKWQDTPNN